MGLRKPSIAWILALGLSVGGVVRARAQVEEHVHADSCTWHAAYSLPEGAWLERFLLTVGGEGDELFLGGSDFVLRRGEPGFSPVALGPEHETGVIVATPFGLFAAGAGRRVARWTDTSWIAETAAAVTDHDPGDAIVRMSIRGDELVAFTRELIGIRRSDGRWDWALSAAEREVVEAWDAADDVVVERCGRARRSVTGDEEGHRVVMCRRRMFAVFDGEVLELSRPTFRAIDGGVHVSQDVVLVAARPGRVDVHRSAGGWSSEPLPERALILDFAEVGGVVYGVSRRTLWERRCVD